MRFEQSFNYRVHVRPRGSQATYVRTVPDSVTLEIEETTSEAAPVVARWTDRFHARPGMGLDREVRRLGDEFYDRLGPEKPDMSKTEMLTRARPAGELSTEANSRSAKSSLDASIPPEELVWFAVLADDRDAWLAHLRDAASRLRFIDGGFLVRCREPVFAIAPDSALGLRLDIEAERRRSYGDILAPLTLADRLEEVFGIISATWHMASSDFDAKRQLIPFVVERPDLLEETSEKLFAEAAGKAAKVFLEANERDAACRGLLGAILAARDIVTTASAAREFVGRYSRGSPELTIYAAIADAVAISADDRAAIAASF